MRFEVKEGFENKIVEAVGKGYKLVYCSNIKGPRPHFYFHHTPNSSTVDPVNSILTKRSEVDSVDLNHGYHPQVASIFALPQGARVVDAGCGLGQVLEKAYEERPDLDLVGIDMVNYGLIVRMLDVVRDEVNPDHLEELEILLRTEQFLRSGKIRFINEKLSDAINNNPDLIGSANIVVDNIGAIAYAPLSEGLCPGAAIQMGLDLLLPGGRIITGHTVIQKHYEILK